MCIRDRPIVRTKVKWKELVGDSRFSSKRRTIFVRRNWLPDSCLLYTSPSPRDGLLSIRRQRQDVYKRQANSPDQSEMERACWRFTVFFEKADDFREA